MSYIVLARKWRPQSFDALIGQESLAKTLKNALSSNKIVHAYLFSGPRGVGKTSSARILAKALNCEQRADSEPCGKCHNCRAVTEGASVDVFEIDGASNTSVDSVRELREAVKYAPSVGKFKVYIIDEVHMLSTPAFNALLKTLEEPPPHVVFIFATTEVKKIPPTILSRCQHHSFRKITKAEIRSQLKKITDSEKIDIQETALDMIAKAADGSMRDALTLLDQAYSFSDKITADDLQSLLGLPEAEIITNLSGTILSGDIAKTLSSIKELTDRGSDLRQLTRELVEHFRNLAIVKVTDDPEGLLEFTHEEVQRLKSQVSDISTEQLTLLLTEMLRIETEVRNAVNPRYTLELGLLRTSFVKGMISIENLLKMLEKPEERGEHSGTPDNITAPLPEKKTEYTEQNTESAGKSEIIENRDKIWQRLINEIDTEDHLLACKLSEAKVSSISSDELIIGFNGGMSVLADSIKSKASIIKSALQKISGQKLKLKIQSLPGNNAENDNKKIKEEVFSEPLVKDAIRIFNGSLVRVKSLQDNSKLTNQK